MDYVVDRAQADGQERRVVVPSRVKAAMGQLEGAEQAAIVATIESV